MEFKKLITKPTIPKTVDPGAESGVTQPSSLLSPNVNNFSTSIQSTPILIKFDDILTLSKDVQSSLLQNIKTIVDDNKSDQNVVDYNNLLSQKFYNPTDYSNNVPPTQISYNKLINVGRTVFRTSTDVRAPLLDVLWEFLQETAISTYIFDRIWQSTIAKNTIGTHLDEPTIMSYFLYKSRNNLNYYKSAGNYIGNLGTPGAHPNLTGYVNGLFQVHDATSPMPFNDLIKVMSVSLADEVIHSNHDYEHYKQIAEAPRKDIWSYIGQQYSLGVSLGVTAGLYTKFSSFINKAEQGLLGKSNTNGELLVFKNSIDRALIRHAQRAEEGLLAMESAFQNLKETTELRIALALKAKHAQASSTAANLEATRIVQSFGSIKF